MRIYLAAQFISGAQIACQQTLVAVEQAKASLFLALLRKLFLLVPLMFILPSIAGLGLTGVVPRPAHRRPGGLYYHGPGVLHQV